MISIPQIRAARGLLGWSQTRLAEEASLSLPTVKRYETGSPLKVSDAAIRAMERAFIEAGVIFVEEDGEGVGVKLRKAGRSGQFGTEPRGPATDAVAAMEEAIKRDKKRRKDSADPDGGIAEDRTIDWNR